MRFSRDRRSQSVVVGTTILFGFLILALSLYQVQVVPQENAQVEFQHFEEVRNDLVELRAGILQAGSTDRPQYQTVRLGTSYSTRLFAINPPAPAGTIRTVEAPPITISNGTPEGTVTIPTRFIQYRPGYNEIDQSPTWYDASVLYVDASEEGGGIAVIEGQELIDNDENVSVVALQNEFRRSGTGRVTVELQPARSVTSEIPDGPLTVTVPTRLSESDWENKTNITSKNSYVSVTDDNNDDIYDLELSTTAEKLTVDTVGVQEAPEEPTQNDDAAVGDSDGSPSEQSSLIRYNNDGKTIRTDDAGVEFSITNVGDQTVEIESVVVEQDTSAAVALRDGSGGGQTVITVSGATDGTYTVGNNNPYPFGDVAVLSSPVSIVPGNDAVISLTRFYSSEEKNQGDYVNMNGETVTVKLIFSDGTERTIDVTA